MLTPEQKRFCEEVGESQRRLVATSTIGETEAERYAFSADVILAMLTLLDGYGPSLTQYELIHKKSGKSLSADKELHDAIIPYIHEVEFPETQ